MQHLLIVLGLMVLAIQTLYLFYVSESLFRIVVVGLMVLLMIFVNRPSSSKEGGCNDNSQFFQKP